MFDSELKRRWDFLLYRFRFLIVYVIIGVLSLILEVVLFRGFERLGLSTTPSNLLALGIGVLFAYWLNVRFNFRIPPAKRNRALLYFVSISTLSGILNFIFRKPLYALGWNYEMSRFAVSGGLFFFAYLLHRRFSFRDRKRVGVAVYANGVEDIRGIWERIGIYPDFIHVDLIDDTFGEKRHEPTYYRLEAIQAFWHMREIEIHLMTRNPGRWLPDVAAYVDRIIVHAEIDEPLESVLGEIKRLGKRSGLCLRLETPVRSVESVSHLVDSIMLLSIATPGKSGQELEIQTLEKIEEINRWKNRSDFILSVDGGVNEKNIHLLGVEHVVSGSSVLQSRDPKRQIMRLQTSGNYDRY